MNTASKIIFFCDLEHVGRNYFAVVVLISRTIRGKSFKFFILLAYNSKILYKFAMLNDILNVGD